MKSVSKYILLLLLISSVAGSVLGETNEVPVSNFELGNIFYGGKKYDSAIVFYQNQLSEGNESANLNFNLGNAYFKIGDLGHAILYYKKANRLNPADTDIRSNLEFAQQFTSVPMEGVTLNPINSFLNSMVEFYRLDSLAWLTSAIFILFIIFLIFRFGLGWNNPLLRIGTIVSLIGLIIFSGLTTFKYQTDFLTPRAVITAEDSIIYTGPTASADVELEGAPGLIVEIIDEAGEYYNILFENKRQGWINKTLVEII